VQHVKAKLARPALTEPDARAAPPDLLAVHCYHGFGANLESFGAVQQRLADSLGGLVSAHDMPGFGLSERPSGAEAYFLTFNGHLGALNGKFCKKKSSKTIQYFERN
jgi:hypothetical protein